MTLLYACSFKEGTGVYSCRTRPPETTQRQASPTTLYKAADQWVPSDRWLVETQFAHVAQNINFDLHAPELSEVQRIQDIDTGVFGRSWNDSHQRRPQVEAKLDGRA